MRFIGGVPKGQFHAKILCSILDVSGTSARGQKEDALDTVKINDDDLCPRCGGKLAFRNTTESPTTGSLVDFFRCQDCGHVRSVVRRSA